MTTVTKRVPGTEHWTKNAVARRSVMAENAFGHAAISGPTLRHDRPLAPGGITDISARLMRQLMRLGEHPVVDNRAGGSGRSALRSRRIIPTIHAAVSTSATNAILPACTSGSSYDALRASCRSRALRARPIC